MPDSELLVRRFEDHRDRLQAVAYRMLGSAAEADDAVQESWLRVSVADTAAVDNLGGWLTTVVGRICLKPAERVAFVLHDMFDLSFDEIAPIVGRTSEATRQIASRARRRVRGGSTPTVDHRRKREVIDAFIAAARSGDLAALVAVLDPEIVLRSDAEVVRLGGPAELHGAAAIAGIFNGRAKACVPGLIDGEPGILLSREGEVLFALELSFSDGRIAAIDAVGDRDDLASLELEQLGEQTR
jgi:RNA polymerase sigma-70 factor (ECF subfamily)